MSDVWSSPFPPAEHAALRKRLPSVLDYAYMNAGSLGPWPDVAIAAQRETLERDAEDRLPVDFMDRMFATQARTRELVARLGSVAPEQVALMHATHEGVNTVIWGAGLRAGDSVVTTDEEHPGLLVPLRIARDRLGIDVRIVPYSDDATRLSEAVTAACDASTRMVALSHVSFRSGRVAPVAALANALDALPGERPLLLVDGAQGAGAVELDLAVLGCDAYTVSGQKWTLGPHGSGALLLADPERLLPTFGANFTVDDPAHPFDCAYLPDGRRFEVAQESVAPMAGLAASLGFLLAEVRVGRAAGHSAWLNGLARAELAPVLAELWQQSGGDASRATCSGGAHLLVMPVPDGTAVRLARRLYESGVVVRPIDDDLLRASLGFWNTPSEVARLADKLRLAVAAETAGATPSMAG